MASLENKYKDWSKVLLEPHSLNDARVFSLESRVKQEEDVRIRENDFLRDLIRKLAYSLEQLSVQNHESKSLKLPSIGPETPRSSRRFDSPGTAKDLMLMKRMSYIRSSLDEHDPRLSTAKSREDAVKKKEERIMEIWKEEYEKPKVAEVIQKL